VIIWLSDYLSLSVEIHT